MIYDRGLQLGGQGVVSGESIEQYITYDVELN